MNPEHQKRNGYRPRLGTLIVLVVVAAPIVVANLNHDVRPPIDNGKGWPPANAAYGWPLIWYWCQFTPSSPARIGGGVATKMHTELVEWSMPRLAGNVVIWLVIFGTVGFACQWLLLGYGSRRSYRPRILTLITLMLVAAPIVLANLSPEYVWGFSGPRYGWPFFWHWRDWQMWYGGATELDHNFSAARLIANLPIWLIMLTASGIACEWLLRRYQPRFRWSLRTMLAAVALVAALCAWGVAIRARAKVQDPIIGMTGNYSPLYPLMGIGHGSPHLYVERWGPKWFDLVGADPFRRSVVGADVQWTQGGDEETLKRLAKLPDLCYLRIEMRIPTAEMVTSLASMRQLRTLRIGDATSIYTVSDECLAAVGQLTRLEHLHLAKITDSRGLAHLAGLKNLRSLSLCFGANYDDEEDSDESEMDLDQDAEDDEEAPDGSEMNLDWDNRDAEESNEYELNGETSILADLPALPRLETLDLRRSFASRLWIDAQDIRHVAALPRLKSLNLSDCDVTDDALAELASLNSLEELAIGGTTVTPAALESLLAAKHLKALHIQGFTAVTKEILAVLPYQKSLRAKQAAQGAMSESEWSVLNVLRWHQSAPSDQLTTLALDHGDRILMWQSDVDGVQRALNALRQAHPSLVIDADPRWFDQHRGEMRDPKLPGQP